MRSWQSVLALLVVGGCELAPLSAPFVAPLDGQTSVGRATPLQVHLGDSLFPTDVPPPQDLVSVVDAETGGFVAGELVHGEGTDLLFVPDDGWLRRHRYVWSVRQPIPQARQPELRVPQELIGEGAFATTQAPEVLDAVARDSGALCLLFSAPLTGGEELDLEVDDSTFDDPAWEPWDIQADEELPLLPSDRGVSAACMTTIQAIAGHSVRVSVDGEGPWQVRVQEQPLEQLLLARHRSLP